MLRHVRHICENEVLAPHLMGLFSEPSRPSQSRGEAARRKTGFVILPLNGTGLRLAALG